MNIFMLGLLQAEASGLHFIYRTAASFVASRAALEPRRLLTFPQLIAPELQSSGPSNLHKPNAQASEHAVKPGGLIVVGSYVSKTTTQLESLLETMDVRPVLVDAQQIISLHREGSSDGLKQIIQDSMLLVDKLLAEGENVVLYSSRGFVADARLQDTSAVSRTITTVIRMLKTQPAFMITKGGITSFDIAKYGLGVSRAVCLGQVVPGVPAWRLQDCQFPGMPFIVFPGNVGDAEALSRVAEQCGVRRRSRDLGFGTRSEQGEAAAGEVASGCSSSENASAAEPVQSEGDVPITGEEPESILGIEILNNELPSVSLGQDEADESMSVSTTDEARRDEVYSIARGQVDRELRQAASVGVGGGSVLLPGHGLLQSLWDIRRRNGAMAAFNVCKLEARSEPDG